MMTTQRHPDRKQQKKNPSAGKLKLKQERRDMATTTRTRTTIIKAKEKISAKKTPGKQSKLPQSTAPDRQQPSKLISQPAIHSFIRAPTSLLVAGSKQWGKNEN